ncbi:GGDEF domain-containing protein [Vibrio sp. THAF190c]|uniref:GGDEF domain-containing protein n=1 Tax=Vibrio sp. THAF190c TaxID=2587865 RepID=UPI0012A83325|nr:GGDEF domain-containing protein [Vibrio sp. THAF190c]QFT09775.1 putative diguanylate cyclase YeaP [Vibrio sp. THAF190c]
MKANPILLIVTLMLLGSFVMLGLSSVTDIDSNYDLFFETNTLIIVIYVYAVARKAILPHKILHFGALLLIFNLCYDVATELERLDEWADRHELIDTFLEDGLLQIAFLLIAIGITQLTSSIKAQSHIDELTGLFNRKKFDTITLAEFDVIYLDLDGLKRVNDLKGHNVGDLMIVRFSQVLRQAAVQDELLFRIGGDEFVVVALKGRSAEFIDQVVNLLHGENIDFSYGVAPATQDTFQQALVASDKAMYTMKKAKHSLKCV